MPNDNTLQVLDQFANLMDRRFTIPGTNIRYGLDAILGLFPGVGDWIGALAALYFPVHAAAVEVPAPVIFRMFVNIFLDLIIGSIPILGDLFDLSWKANVRNVRLMQEYQKDPETTREHSRWLIWTLVAVAALLIILLLVLLSWLIVRLIEYLF